MPRIDEDPFPPKTIRRAPAGQCSPLARLSREAGLQPRRGAWNRCSPAVFAPYVPARRSNSAACNVIWNGKGVVSMHWIYKLLFFIGSILALLIAIIGAYKA